MENTDNPIHEISDISEASETLEVGETQGPPPPPQQPQQPEHTRPSWLPPPPVQNKHSYHIPIALFVGCLPWTILFIMAIVAIIGAAISSSGPSNSRKHIALIRVEGEIVTGRSSPSFMGSVGAGSETIINQLEEARKNRNAKGILLRIDSPGGSPAASEEIFNEVMRIRKEGKPVYVSMGDLAASGGYYVSAAADKIYADSSTLTGSIGVIWKSSDMSKLFKMIGYSPNVIKAGKYKDMNNPSRAMTAEEKQFVQKLVDSTYNEFLSAVAAGRKKPIAQIRKIAEGRIYDGRLAKKIGLVDEIGGFEETRAALGMRCGLGSNARVSEYGSIGLFEEIFMGSESTSEKFGASFMRGAIRTLVEENKGELR